MSKYISELVKDRLQYYKVPILKVKSVVPYQIYDVYWNTTKLSENKANEFIKFIENNEITGTREEINTLIHGHFPSIYMDDYNENKYGLLNMSLSVNSYYLEDVENVEYLEHDGVTMLLELENGKTMEVWGD